MPALSSAGMSSPRPPFDDPDVIAGQGTVGMEILHQHPGPIEAIFVPIGGGGLAAGIAAYVKFLRPQTRVIGVEPVDAASMQAALAAGAPVGARPGRPVRRRRGGAPGRRPRPSSCRERSCWMA